MDRFHAIGYDKDVFPGFHGLECILPAGICQFTRRHSDNSHRKDEFDGDTSLGVFLWTNSTLAVKLPMLSFGLILEKLAEHES